MICMVRPSPLFVDAYPRTIQLSILSTSNTSMPKERTKQRRSTRACDFCHSRGVRCRQSDTVNPPPELTCTTCIEYGESCTWNRATKRGTKSGTASIVGTALSWKQKVSENRVSMSPLIDVYLDTIHPVFRCTASANYGWAGGILNFLPARPNTPI